MAKLRGATGAALRAAGRNRGWVWRKLLQSFAGIFVSVSLVIPDARLFARSIYDGLEAGASEGDCRVSFQSLRDVRYWANFGRHGHGRPIWAAPAAQAVRTDALGYGWCGVLDGHFPVRGPSGVATGWHINIKEVVAVRYALNDVSHWLKAGSRIRVVTGSQVALHVTNALLSRSSLLCHEVRPLHALSRTLGVTLEAEWIPTTEILWADKPSRSKDPTKWQFGKTYFEPLDSVCGPHTFDRLGTSCNACPLLYNSSVWDPQTFPGDEFSQSWGGQHEDWLNPPFNREPLVLDEIRKDRATATIILLGWRAQSWCVPALVAANEVWYLPRRAGLLFRAVGGAQAPRPHWMVCALRFKQGGWDLPRRLGTDLPRRLGDTPLPRALAALRLPKC